MSGGKNKDTFVRTRWQTGARLTSRTGGVSSNFDWKQWSLPDALGSDVHTALTARRLPLLPSTSTSTSCSAPPPTAKHLSTKPHLTIIVITSYLTEVKGISTHFIFTASSSPDERCINDISRHIDRHRHSQTNHCFIPNNT